MELAPEVKRVFEYFNPDLDINAESKTVTEKVNELQSLKDQLPQLLGFVDLRSRFVGLSIGVMKGIEHAKDVIEYSFPNGLSSSEYYKMPLKSLSLVVLEVAAVFNEDKRKSYNYKSVEEYANTLFNLINYVELGYNAPEV